MCRNKYLTEAQGVSSGRELCFYFDSHEALYSRLSMNATLGVGQKNSEAWEMFRVN